MKNWEKILKKKFTKKLSSWTQSWTVHEQKVHDFMNKFSPGIAYRCLVVKMAGHTNQFSPEIQTFDDFLTIVKGHNFFPNFLFKIYPNIFVNFFFQIFSQIFFQIFFPDFFSEFFPNFFFQNFFQNFFSKFFPKFFF